MNRVVEEQRLRNARSREAWQTYAAHRLQVTALLSGLRAAAGDRLCVLGAGNSNDLELFQLCDHYAEVHLVDLDSEALQFGAARQLAMGSASDKCVLHGDVDLSGIAGLLAGWQPGNSPGAEEYETCLRSARHAPIPDLPRPFDVVASICLLTQLIDAIKLTLGERDPRFLELVVAVRTRHLHLLLDLLRPGGRALLVTDVVSSETFAELGTLSDADFPPTLARLIAAHNFFTGVNPFVLRREFEADSELADRAERVELLRPWRWDFGPRIYAVCAIRLTAR